LSASVSVIISVFNGARYLGAAIDSVLGQTWPGVELIVVDDGSTDTTPDVIAGYGSRIVSIRQENRGVSAARNVGLHAAKGPFLALLDADDIWLPEKVARQMEYLERNPASGGCVTLVENFFTDGETVKENPRLAAPVAGFSMSALLAPRGLFDRVGAFGETARHSGSIDWFLAARELGERIDVVQEVLVRRRLHDQNMSRRDSSLAKDELLDAIKRSLDRGRAGAPGPRSR
jgi:glycosyltransferase involved in cell wall biosynthesis